MGLFSKIFKKKNTTVEEDRDEQAQFLKDEQKRVRPAAKEDPAPATTAFETVKAKPAEDKKSGAAETIVSTGEKPDPKAKEKQKPATAKKASPEAEEKPKTATAKKANPEAEEKPKTATAKKVNPEAEEKKAPKGKDDPKEKADKPEPKRVSEKKSAAKKAPKAAEEKEEPLEDAPAPDDNEDPDSETVTVSKITRNGNFDIKRAKDGRFYFNLYASNRARIASSQIYSGSQSAVNGIKSVIANAGKAPIEDTTLKKPTSQPFPKWEIYIDKAGQYRFRLYASNGSCICHSHGYASKATCKGGIESIIRFAAEAEINKKYLK